MQVVEAFGGDAITTPAGRTSVKSRLVTGNESMFVMLKTSWLSLPRETVSGVKTFSKKGGGTLATALPLQTTTSNGTRIGIEALSMNAFLRSREART